MSQRGVLNIVDARLSDASPPEEEPTASSSSPIPSVPKYDPSDRTQPYELPQLPIELIEKKLDIQRQISKIDRIDENSEAVMPRNYVCKAKQRLNYSKEDLLNATDDV